MWTTRRSALVLLCTAQFIDVLGAAVVVVARMMRPHTAVLGHLPDADAYRNVERFPEAEQTDGVVVVRFDVSLSYLNAEFMKDRIRHVMDAATHPRALVLDMSGVNDIDSSAVETLTELIDELADRGVVVHLSAGKGPVRDVLTRTAVPDRLAGTHVHIRDAVAAAAPTSRRDRVTGQMSSQPPCDRKATT